MGEYKYGRIIASGLLDVAGSTGVYTLTDENIKVGDVPQITLASDDTGTPITSIIPAIADGSMTITVTDDGSSSDDATFHYTIFRT